MLSPPAPHAHPVARRKRTAFSSTRIIPSLQRHETMLFGDALNPVPCQSHKNHVGMLDESNEEERKESQSSAGTSEEERGESQSSAGTSQESAVPKKN